MTKSHYYLVLIIFVFCFQFAAASNLVSLVYDDGTADDGQWIDNLRGHAVVFTAPCNNWTLSEVAIYGGLVPKPASDVFVLEVWDQNLSLLSRTTDRPKAYFNDNFTWAVVDMPDIKVSGNFIVSFYEFGSVYLGVDVSPASGRSIITARNPDRILPWSLTNHSWNQTNWMIRALGYSPAPNMSLKILSDKASQSSPAKFEVKATDPDGNLKSATLYVVDNKTREIVWSEVKELKGSSAQAQFSWPGTMFQIAADSKAAGPVFSVNNIGVPANMSDLLNRAAPCILELEKNMTVSAMAYFGMDGKLNALIDGYGFSHYLSRDVLNRTRPGNDYTAYIKNNVTIIKDKSQIFFIKELVPLEAQDQRMATIGPISLSGSPLFNYGINLKEAGAGAGDFQAMVEVADTGLNVVSGVGEKAIKII